MFSTGIYVTWNTERDLTAKNCISGWMVIFAANLTLFHALTAWIYIQREEFNKFTIFCRIFCWLVEIYYWLLQNQCSGSRRSHISRFILVNFKCGEMSSLWPAVSYTDNSNRRLRIHGLHSLRINTSDVKNQHKTQFLAVRFLSIFHVRYMLIGVVVLHEADKKYMH